jgi:hypothetical protein
MLRRILLALAITLGVTGATTVVTQAPASAASWCNYERVNFTDRYGPADYKVHTYQQCNVSGSGGTYATMTYRIHHCGLASWVYWSQHIGAVYVNPTAFGWCT